MAASHAYSSPLHWYSEGSTARKLVEPELTIAEAIALPAARPLARPQVRVKPGAISKLGYVMLGVAMALVLAQAVRCLVGEAFRLTGLLRNYHAVMAQHGKTQAEHELLRDTIQVYTSKSGIEELARNKLGMVGDGEVLVRVYR